jgi:hypothetical protein
MAKDPSTLSQNENASSPTRGLACQGYSREYLAKVCFRAWSDTASDWTCNDEMVNLYTHLRPEYRKRVLNKIPSLRNKSFENVGSGTWTRTRILSSKGD